jgi:hypothetical protein
LKKAALALSLAAALALAACGDDDGGEEQAAEQEPKSAVVVDTDVPTEVTSDVVVVEGTVKPKDARLEVANEVVEVDRQGHFRARFKVGDLPPVEGAFDESYTVYVEATAPGYNRTKREYQVTRTISAAELRAQREAARARREQRRQDLIATAQTIDYDQLNKCPECHTGEKVKYTGQIFQIQEDPLGGGIMLLSVTDEGYGFWTDEIWVNYKGSVESAEEDVLTVYGTVKGSKSYETQIGGERYVPEIDAGVIEE